MFSRIAGWYNSRLSSLSYWSHTALNLGLASGGHGIERVNRVHCSRLDVFGSGCSIAGYGTAVIVSRTHNSILGMVKVLEPVFPDLDRELVSEWHVNLVRAS